MLNCQKCGFSNELGRIFCHSCGTKLDLSQMKAPGQGGPKLKSKKDAGPWRTFRVLFELVILLGIIFAVYLIVQVPETAPAKIGGSSLASLDGKRFDLDRLVTRGRAGSVTITENEANAFLGALTMEKAPNSWLVFAPATVAMDFLDNEVSVKLWGEMRLGGDLKKELFFSYTCVPTLTDSGLHFQPSGGAVGSLPIHPTLLRVMPVVQKFVGAVFSRLKNERAILEKMDAIHLTDNSAKLEYAGSR